MRLRGRGVLLGCLALGCGSSGPTSDASGSGGTGSGHDGAAATGDSSSDGPSPDRPASDGAAPEVAMLEQCPAQRPQYDAAAFQDPACTSTDDTDHDGLRDCVDGCPYDATKVAPGVCGCDTPDVDSDGDGVPDCLDQCPLDPNNTVNGQCGCVGEPGLAAMGDPCSDPACPQANATCNGAGVCGDRDACRPCMGGRYIITPDARRYYWFCGASLPPETGAGCAAKAPGAVAAPATRVAAQAVCQANGLTLARVDTLDDERYLTQLLTAPLWIGANDLQTPGQWYWPSSTTDSDKLMWSGGPDGGQQNAAFNDWAAGAPGANACATITTKGQWTDTACAETHGYICEYQTL